MLDYKKYLCQLIDDLGGEVIFDKIDDNYIIHYYEDGDKLVITTEVKQC